MRSQLEPDQCLTWELNSQVGGVCIKKSPVPVRAVKRGWTEVTILVVPQSASSRASHSHSKAKPCCESSSVRIKNNPHPEVVQDGVSGDDKSDLSFLFLWRCNDRLKAEYAEHSPRRVKVCGRHGKMILAVCV